MKHEKKKLLAHLGNDAVINLLSTALNLFTVLAQHLQNNGHDLKKLLPKQDFYGNPC
jgi:hypothetical protein